MMKALRLITIASLVCLVSACGKEPPPRSVSELVDSPFLLEAAMVRCAQDRTKTKYDPECINAREAANRLAADEREARHEDLEAQSERKRKALRRTQEAAAEARRRAAEAQQLREEAEYLGVFETIPDDGSGAPESTGVVVDTQPTVGDAVLPGNQPGVALLPPDSQGDAEADDESVVAPTDLESIREELKGRQLR